MSTFDNIPRDQNGNRVSKNVKKEQNGTWSANVWFGANPATNLSRYGGYKTRKAAYNSDIGDEHAIVIHSDYEGR